MKALLHALLAMAIALLALAAPARAQPLTGPEADPAPHVAIELVADSARPKPGGEVTLAFVSTPAAGWHGYWKNPGDAGVETSAKWDLPDGVTAGPIQYPVPERLLIAGLMNYVYEGPFAQFVTLKLPPTLAAGTAIPIRVKLDYLVCTRKICVPESRTLATTLTVGDGAVTPERQLQFARWRAKIPSPPAIDGRFELSGNEGGKLFRLALPFSASAPLRDPYFYPLTEGAFDYAAPQAVTRDGDTVLVEVKAAKSPAVVEGVLGVGDGQGLLVRAVPGSLPVGAGGALPWSTILLSLGAALVGGLILNVMPCVFPILSLKALSLARANESDRHARQEALAYSAGVVLVCLALGGALLALRAAGSNAGWAFQLQDARVILFLLLLVTAIALNLAGLFEISAPGFINRAAARSSGGAFATGALAAFIATPCTGPFMGGALFAALVLPWWASLVIFAGLGVGLALPFLALGYIPRLRRMLPKPGAWMETFRHILSIPMFLTALALAWVLGRQAGVEGMTWGLGAALLLALGLWWGGARQSKGRTRPWWPALIMLIAALAAVPFVRASPAATAQPTQTGKSHEPFSEARLAALRAENRAVFAYFTADWCITCKINERGVIETEAVEQALAKNDVAVLVGDWTNGDPALSRFIEQHNRAGVPLYLWYVPGESEPRVLPQILTRTMLADLAALSRKP
jgi:DsbC/DsbD-like thiol-disulfide interchange protein/cytochrome c biogenesis protein CcdA